MKFNYAHETPQPSGQIANNRYGQYLEPLKKPANIGYLQLIDLIALLWGRAHPEIRFGPLGDSNLYTSELGYITYSLDQKSPSDGQAKPKQIESLDDSNDVNKKIITFKQSFNYLIRFTAFHRNPRVAEEILEAFELFMLENTKHFHAAGIENLYYSRRYKDQMNERTGDDTASRSVCYLVILQQVLYVSQEKLKEVEVIVQAYIQCLATEQATPNLSVYLLDNHATPLAP